MTYWKIHHFFFFVQVDFALSSLAQADLQDLNSVDLVQQCAAWMLLKVTMIGDRPILSHLVLASHPRSNFSLVRLAPWNTTSAPTIGVWA